jgi:protein-S-isoprenylcysteine O-methyltransferase Ste14
MKKAGSFLVGIVVFLLLPLASWGLNDLSGFISNPYRLAFLGLMSIASLLAVLFVPNEGRGFGKGEKPLERQKWSLPALQIITVLMVLAPPYFDRHRMGIFPHSDGIRIAGLALVAFGFFLMNWSVVALGKQFSVEVTLQKDHQLITSGPYQAVRHPRYLGILIFMIGMALVFASWIALSVCLPLLGVLISRIRDEEIMMREAFPTEWEAYQKRTNRLIPWIY